MLVDDNVSFLKQLSAILGDSYDLLLAKSGEMALTIGSTGKPDLILLDIEMPGMNGFETLKKMKEQPWFGVTPVVFVTGNHDEGTKAEALKLGAMDILFKPIDRDVLHSRIELFL